MMEYSKYLIQIKPKLLEITDCNVKIIAECKKEGIFSKSNESALKAENNDTNRNDQFWGYISTKIDCWKKLISIFGDDNQNAVVDLLEKGKRDDGSDDRYDFIKNLKPLDVIVEKKKKGETIVHADAAYSLDPEKIGMALVININQFDDQTKNRKGSENDFEYMVKLWSEMGYQVCKHQGKFNKKDIDEFVERFLRIFRKKNTPESCVVFIGTHGENGRLSMADGTTIRLYEDFIFKFEDQNMFGNPRIPKPRLFFIQACRYFPNSNSEVSKRLSEMKHAIISFCTVEGEGANRHEVVGSFYVYTLTEVFMRKAYKMELQKMLDEVRRNMLNGIQAPEPNTQVSCYQPSTDFGPLYFNLMEY